MILRRITQHVKDQNWTAIAIDLGIVVLGVFLGLQVQEWSADRARAAQAVGDGEQLRGVATRAVRNTCGSVSYYATLRLSADRALAILDGAGGSDAELVAHAYRATEAIDFSVEDGLFAGIVSDGRLGDIEDAALSGSLLRYFGGKALAQGYRDAHTSPYRTHIRRRMAHPVQEAIRARCSDDRSGPTLTLTSSCALDLTPDAVQAAAQALRADDEAALLLAEHYSLLNILVTNSQFRVEQLVEGLGETVADDVCQAQVKEPVLLSVTLAEATR